MKGFALSIMLVAGAIVGSCQAAGPSTDAPAGEAGAARRSEARAGNEGVTAYGDEAGGLSEAQALDCEPPLRCSMAGLACPSANLPRFTTELDADGWTRLRALAEQGLVVVAMVKDRDDLETVETIELVEGCRLPGRYHEAVAAPESPGRAWASDRLAFVPAELPDEPRTCARATHFVASFAVADDSQAEAIALPLPCPPLGSGTPRACIGAGLDDQAREAAARSRWELAEPLIERADWAGFEAALPPLLELAALMPSPWSYGALAGHLRFLGHEQHGGCLWHAEAAFAAHALDPEYKASVDVSNGRVAPSHERPDCDTRPSLLTCFPERFTPGTGDNCW